LFTCESRTNRIAIEDRGLKILVKKAHINVRKVASEKLLGKTQAGNRLVFDPGNENNLNCLASIHGYLSSERGLNDLGRTKVSYAHVGYG
jgi:hypothetical protein